MSQIKITKKDVFWNYIGTLFNMGSNYMQLPFLLYFLKSDKLGLWYVLMSLSAISNLITFGFTPSFSRSVAYCWSGARSLSKEEKTDEPLKKEERDYGLLQNIISTCKLVYLLMAVIAVILLSTIGTIYVNHIASNIMCTNIRVGWCIFLIAVFINIYYGYYHALLVGVGGIKEDNQAITIANVVRIVLLVILLLSGLDFAGACITFLGYGFLMRILCKYFLERRTALRKIIKKSNIHKSKTDVISCFLTLWHNAWRDGMVSVSDYISTQAGTLICSTFMSLEQTATYSILSQIAVAVAKISRSVDNAHLSVIQSAYINNDKIKMKQTQAMCVAGYVIVFFAGVLGMCFVGFPIIHFAMPGIKLDIVLFMGLAAYHFIISFRNCYAAYLSSTNRLWYWKSYIFASFICLFLEVVLFKTTEIGAEVIVIASIMSEVIYNIWHWPMLVNKELGMRKEDYFRGAKDFTFMFMRRKNG